MGFEGVRGCEGLGLTGFRGFEVGVCGLPGFEALVGAEA